MESNYCFLLEKATALRGLLVSSLVKRTEVCIDGGGRDLRPKDHNIERAFLPSEVGGSSRLSD